MPDDPVRGHPPRAQQLDQPHLHREQARLGVEGLFPQPGLVATGLSEDDLGERDLQVGVQVGADRVDGLGEHGEPLVELVSHAWCVAGLPREEKPDPPGCGCGGGGGAVGDLGQAGPQLPRGVSDHHRPVAQAGPGRGQGQAHVRDPDVRMLVQPVPQPGRLLPQRRLRPRRNHPRNRNTTRTRIRT